MMKKILAGSALVVLMVIVCPKAQAADCSRMKAPSWDQVLIGEDTPDETADTSRPSQLQNNALPRVSDGSQSPLRPNMDHCPFWACWQDEWGCLCSGFWCGPVFICGEPCRESGC